MEEAQAYIKAHTGERPQITSFDGLRLTALYLPAPGGSPKGTVLAFHGYRSLATIDFALEVEFFHRLGYDVLLPYQRSHGPSQGRHITFGVKERFDCRDWAWYVARRFGEDRPLYLAGISMGCATVLMSLSLNLPPNVRGVLADCGFTSPWEIVRHVAKADFHLPAFPLLWLLDLWCRALAGFSLKEADTRKGPGEQFPAGAVPPRKGGQVRPRLHDRGELPGLPGREGPVPGPRRGPRPELRHRYPRLPGPHRKAAPPVTPPGAGKQNKSFWSSRLPARSAVGQRPTGA